MGNVQKRATGNRVQILLLCFTHATLQMQPVIDKYIGNIANILNKQ